MYDKEYIHEQVLKCRDKFEEIMEEIDKADDPTFSQMLINLDNEFSVLYDRWVLYFTNHECPNHPKQTNEGPNSFYVP